MVFPLRIWSKSMFFLELLFSLDCHFGDSNLKNEAWWDFYFSMLTFRKIFILADKISRFAKSWLPIQNLNSVARSEIPYLNWMYDFVTFSHNFCQNAWTSSPCTHPNNGVFSISTVVMWTRNAQVSFHIINLWISSILEIPVCIFSLRNSCNVQFHVDHILFLIYIFPFKL